MKNVVILQSNYIPWKGYFDLICDADLFIFYDDLQFTKNDWRNRNKIKTPRGLEWITIPVGTDSNRLICEVQIKDYSWQAKHWKTIQQHYGKSPYFASYRDFFEDIYLGQKWTNLSVLNQTLIRSISSEILNIKTEFRDSRDYNLSGLKLERLLELVTKAEADRYISGPAAKDYIDPSRFAEANIELIWKDYSGYPEYPQRFPPFEHGVSILDLIFNVGSDAPWYIWEWRKSETQSI
ncbi:WbqC family protein [Chromatium okenii]|uniref:WbqC family protein n=1 Tax=Chromatium okenii TaxID=61644 RepID=UPI0026EF3574|nr:WbqC family protein [Chromatium okenii]MBV5310570.1 WbqC family protein [Chromatium okenii]